MAEELAELLYLNPLALEATYFLQTLRLTGKTYKQIDPNLGKLLLEIMSELEKYMDVSPVQIVATDNTKLVDEKELQLIKRSFQCAKCSYKDIGNTISQAAMHLAKGHARTENQIRAEKAKEERQKKNKNNNAKKLVLPKKAKALINNQDISTFIIENIQIGEKLKKLPEYNVIEEQLLALVNPLFKDKSPRVYKFGSRLSGIGTRTSDLDLFIDVDNNFNKFENRASPETVVNLQTVRNALRSNKQWKVYASIENARVPIIKVNNVKTGIDCDIGFSNSLGFLNTTLVAHIFELQPVARCMCIFLKRWLERSKMSEHISTYTVTMMVVYFLQLQKLLPSIEKMQLELDKTEVCVGPWLTNFKDRKLAEYKIEKLEVDSKKPKKFLREFFEYYANFKYDTKVVCPYFGTCNVEIKLIERAMPKRYTDYVSANRDAGLQLSKPMVVQDPIQLNHNVTKGISAIVLQQFIEYCRQSAALFPEDK